MARPRTISLFSGAGGLDYGFEAAGFDTGVAVEMNRDACTTLRRNRPTWQVIERDIMHVSSAEILRAAQLKREQAAVLIGGPPCQPFSKGGYWSHGDARRLADPRSNTLSAYLRVLEDTLPEAFVLENVEGLAYREKDEGLNLLLSAIRAINKRNGTNYVPTVEILNAADFGVPQLRKRVIVVGFRSGNRFTFPARTHGFDSGLEKHRTSWDALADVKPSANEDLALTGKWAGLLPSIPEGHNYLWHTDRMGGKRLFGWRSRYWSFLLKLAKAQPSWTIQAQPGPSIGPFHWENRRLSMRELCRLQTFPDDIEIHGTRIAIQRQLGNAVPSLLGEIIGRAIQAQVFGFRVSGKLKLMPAKRPIAPPPETTSRVPKMYMNLEGYHPAHAGPGAGPAARRRNI
jgi:DNA (cytosine-5)-methyltransferase 1